MVSLVIRRHGSKAAFVGSERMQRFVDPVSFFLFWA